MDAAFPELVSRLHAEVGQYLGEFAHCDLEDEHCRLAIYHSAMEIEALRPLLLACLRRDPDRLMVSGVIAELLEATAAAERDSVFQAVVQPGRDDFVRQRAKELTLIETLIARGDRATESTATSDEIERLLAGTNWLQRIAAGTATTPNVLDALAKRGRARYIREAAQERRQRLDEAPLLERLTSEIRGEAAPEEIERLIAGSDWLQRQVAETGTVANAIEALAKRGRTHRTRGLARDRLHRLKRST